MGQTEIRIVAPAPLAGVGQALLWTILLLVCICRIVPLAPEMPAAGLDPSWRFGMEQAMAQGLAIGRDLVFTFGPYAAVYTRNYHPATDALALFAGAYLALSYALTLGLFIKTVHWRWLLALVIVFSGLIYLSDALWFALPLLVALQVHYRWAGAQANQPGWRAPLLLALLFFPLGLLPLVKGTLIVLCGAVATLCAGYLFLLRRRLLAALCVLAPLLSMMLCWIIAGQALSTLPVYFTSMLPIIAGYTEAMAYSGAPHEPILVLIGVAMLLNAIARHPGLDRNARGFLFMLFGGCLFIAFKAGFVRHDGHAVIASVALLIAATALPLVLCSRKVMIAWCFSLFCWFAVNQHYQHITPASLANDLRNTYVSAWTGARQRLQQDWPRSQYAAVLQQLRERAALPVLPGSSDIYGYDQTDLIASGNQWAPRPIMQSYSAYTLALAERNRSHLLGPDAPQNIFFRLQSIDNRYPSLDDGASWPVLLTHYVPAGVDGDTVILKRRQNVGAAAAMAAMAPSTHRFKETVALPTGTAPLFVQLDIQPSLAGRLAALLYRPSQLNITVTLADGSSKTYRVPSGMARAGFVLSPLVQTTAQFTALYGGQGVEMGQPVVTFKIDTDRRARWFWQAEYGVALSALHAGG